MQQMRLFKNSCRTPPLSILFLKKDYLPPHTLTQLHSSDSRPQPSANNNYNNKNNSLHKQRVQMTTAQTQTHTHTHTHAHSHRHWRSWIFAHHTQKAKATTIITMSTSTELYRWNTDRERKRQRVKSFKESESIEKQLSRHKSFHMSWTKSCLCDFLSFFPRFFFNVESWMRFCLSTCVCVFVFEHHENVTKTV